MAFLRYVVEITTCQDLQNFHEEIGAVLEPDLSWYLGEVSLEGFQRCEPEGITALAANELVTYEAIEPMLTDIRAQSERPIVRVHGFMQSFSRHTAALSTPPRPRRAQRARRARQGGRPRARARRLAASPVAQTFNSERLTCFTAIKRTKKRLADL